MSELQPGDVVDCVSPTGAVYARRAILCDEQLAHRVITGRPGPEPHVPALDRAGHACWLPAAWCREAAPE